MGDPTQGDSVNPLRRPVQRPGGAPQGGNPFGPGGPARPPQQGAPQQRPPAQRPNQPQQGNPLTQGTPRQPQQAPQNPMQRPVQPPQRTPRGVPVQRPAQQQRPQTPPQAPTQRPAPQQQMPPQRSPQMPAPQQPQRPVQQIPSQQPAARPAPELPDGFELPEEEDVFTPIGEGLLDEEQDDLGSEDINDILSDPSPQSPGRSLGEQVSPPPASERVTRRNSPQIDDRMALEEAEPLESYEERPSFVDKKTKKLKPFGKKNIKVSDLDDRKDLSGSRKATQIVVIAGVLSLIAFGAFKTFWPQESLSVADVRSISLEANGEIGYPTQRAEGFAKSFVEAYLTVDNRNETSKTMIASFYGSENTAPTRSESSDLVQKIITGPIVFDSTPISPSSGNFTIGALVSTAGEGTKNPDTDPTNTRWAVFSVNVYYSAKSDSFAVTPDSPTVLPPESIKPSSEVPGADTLGEKVDNNVNESIKSTVTGFVKAFQESTENSHSAMDQYVIADAPPELMKGLGGKFTFENPEDPDSSINYEAFQPSAAGELKVIVNTKWTNRANNSEASISYASKYVMTLEKQGNGKYLVSKFAPFYYVEAPPEP